MTICPRSIYAGFIPFGRCLLVSPNLNYRTICIHPFKQHKQTTVLYPCLPVPSVLYRRYAIWKPPNLELDLLVYTRVLELTNFQERIVNIVPYYSEPRPVERHNAVLPRSGRPGITALYIEAEDAIANWGIRINDPDYRQVLERVAQYAAAENGYDPVPITYGISNGDISAQYTRY